MRFGTLSIDPINRQVLLSGELIALSTADFDLLWELATHAGQIMDRDALLKNLRGVSYDGMDRSVDVAISRLRKKLQDNATEPYRIKTVRNKGYLFAPHAWKPDYAHRLTKHARNEGITSRCLLFLAFNYPFAQQILAKHAI
jgi:two-component system response regulator RstA